MDKLQEIKEQMDKVTHLAWITGTISCQDVYWLIEAVEQQQKVIESLDSLIEDANRWMDDADKRDDCNDVFYHEGKKHAYQHVKELLKVR